MTTITRTTQATSVSATTEVREPGPARTDSLGRQRFAASFVPPSNGPVKVAFFDADSTLRVAPSGKVSANGPTDVALLPSVADELAELHKQGYLIVIVSNQSGVEFGHVSLNDADAALQTTIDLIRKAGGDVHYYDFAEQKGPRRKPDIGMAADLEKNLVETFGKHAVIDKANSMMVGDSAYKKDADVRPDGKPGINFSNADRLFAENLGIPFHEPQHFFGWHAMGVEGFENHDALKTFQAERESKSATVIGREQAPLTSTPTEIVPSKSSAMQTRLALLTGKGD